MRQQGLGGPATCRLLRRALVSGIFGVTQVHRHPGLKVGKRLSGQPPSDAFPMHFSATPYGAL
jgi:hypothetical protein